MLNFDVITQLSQIEIVMPNQPIVIYGAGMASRIMIEQYKKYGIEILAICDSNTRLIGSKINGIEIQSFESVLAQGKDFLVTIAVGDCYYDEVKSFLLQYISKEQLYKLNITSDWNTNKSERYKQFAIQNLERYKEAYTCLEDDLSRKTLEKIIVGNLTCDANIFRDIAVPQQYFNELTKSEYEPFYIDAGAFDGDTLASFIEFTKNCFGRAIFFEPDINCYGKLENRKKQFVDDIAERIELHNEALYSRNEKVYFDYSQGDSSNRISSNNTSENGIQAVTVDQFNFETVSFIKMDIEGSELSALRGAEETIKRDRPKLAICIYHEIQDFIEIMEYISNLNLGYRFYLRHHGSQAVNEQYETVLYAVYSN
jgi:FkbM family methyltransferase